MGAAAIVLILVLGFWDWRSAESDDTGGGYWANPAAYFALHTVTANVVMALLFAGAAWLFYDARRQDRERLINDSTTAIGFAGSVRPLLGTSYVLGQLGAGQGESLKEQQATAATDPTTGRGPHKWVRPRLTERWPEPPSDRNTPSDDLQIEADLLDECIRQLVGTVRDWADLFVTTELGRQGSYCIQVTRRDLQQLMQTCRDGTLPQPDEFWELGKKVAQLAQAFEAASDPGTVRTEVRNAEKFYGLKPALDEEAGNLAKRGRVLVEESFKAAERRPKPTKRKSGP